LSSLVVEDVGDDGPVLRVRVRTTTPEAACPLGKEGNADQAIPMTGAT
jgi:hypothetical protein